MCGGENDVLDHDVNGLNETEYKARKRVCLPLDGINPKQAQEMIKELSPYVGLFKINSLFTTMGPAAIDMIHKYGAECFLDLKFHDIPNTVENYAYEATKHKVKMFNVHAGGGLEMMMSAVNGAEKAATELGIERPEIYGVTVLTSLDVVRLMHNNQPFVEKAIEQEICYEQYYSVAKLQAEQKKGKTLSPDEIVLLQDWAKQIDITYPFMENVFSDSSYVGIVKKQVLHYARLAEHAGLDGIVCSAAELDFVKPQMKPEFKYITPGIEAPITGQVGADQLRTLTPSKAVKAGSNILVVGRAITKTEDSLTQEEKYKQMQQNAYAVLQDIASVLQGGMRK